MSTAVANRASSRRKAKAVPPSRGTAASPWRMAESEELRHTVENGRAEQALQVQAVWRPGVTTAALTPKEPEALSSAAQPGAVPLAPKP